MIISDKNDRINGIFDIALKNIQNLVDVNTVVGSPITTDSGDCIIPVSKVSFGVLTGGGEYGKVNIFKNSSDLPFSAGNGTVVAIKPCGFLIKSDGEYRVLPVGSGNLDAALDKVTDFFQNLNKDDNNDKSED
ncbi:MAG: sporulation protein YtfJ [Clostridia bacterium]|nr:sporulation protein YtfJ [Clostridia bacterium]